MSAIRVISINAVSGNFEAYPFYHYCNGSGLYAGVDGAMSESLYFLRKGIGGKIPDVRPAV